MKLLLTSCGWEYNPKIAKEFLRLAKKKPAQIKVFHYAAYRYASAGDCWK